MEDLIRRSDAIEVICEIVPIRKDAIEIADAIRAIPSADIDLSGYSDKLWKNAYERGKADRPQGEWIRREYWSEGVGMGESYGFYYECSNCGEQQKGGYDNCGINYCPDCGAKMRGNRNE